MLRILDTQIGSAERNMQIDADLLENLGIENLPVLHLYEWAYPSATFGYFTNPALYLNMEKAKRHGLDFAKRPTGGGIVFHIWDLAFSFLMPASHPKFSINTLENYAFVNNVVVDVVKNYFALSSELIREDEKALSFDCKHFCMAMPTKYDVVYQGVKIAGAAQRRKKGGYLHQGTISLSLPNYALLEDVLLSKEVLEGMRLSTFSPIKKEKELLSTRKELQKLLADKLREALEFYP